MKLKVTKEEIIKAYNTIHSLSESFILEGCLPF